MAAAIADNVPRYARAAVESLSPDDFETASIRSAAPSYTSEAPSYHSTNPHPDPLPAYSPPEPASSSSRNRRSSNGSSTGTGTGTVNHSVSSLLDLDVSPTHSSTTTTTTTTNQNPTPRSSSSSMAAPRYGLPPVPPAPPRRHGQDLPSLSQFRIPPWSPASSAARNPTARIYQNVALRRAAAAVVGGGGSYSSSSYSYSLSSGSSPGSGASSSSSTAALDGLMRSMMLERIEEEERSRVRPLEDPYLVGEEAATRARAERMARERAAAAGDSGEEVLVRENRRWDLFLAQMKEQEARERSWRRLRRGADRRPTTSSRLPFRIGARS